MQDQRNPRRLPWPVTTFLLLLLTGCAGPRYAPRQTENFNAGWEFHAGELADPAAPGADWEPVLLPHDWSIRAGYTATEGAASTGFVRGGVGWYRKKFLLPRPRPTDHVRIEFDGVYANSEVWINGHSLGVRPNGYSSFSYPLTEHLYTDGRANELLVRVDHSAYADTRWYTGSGIYRNVRLVSSGRTYIPQWGVRVTTPRITDDFANLCVLTSVVNAAPTDELRIRLTDPRGEVVEERTIQTTGQQTQSCFVVPSPARWDTETPNLYTCRTTVLTGGKPSDAVDTRFGIRSIEFDAERGFLLNGVPTKLRGVNLHHDVGALGAAARKDSWRYRLGKLRGIGVNAVRMSHNPHAPELMEVCDEMGMLVMNEFFDEWHRPKDKSLVYLGDNAARGAIAAGYSEHFATWAERDLKDLIRRDYNHPSVIMWSIGNEIEWTFPKYSAAFAALNPDLRGYGTVPVYDPAVVRPVVDSILGEPDSLTLVARQLVEWVKEEDSTRPTTCGSVRPPIALAAGYGRAVDVLGFNYRQESYDTAHKYYPDVPLLGSENWGAYSEWAAVRDRDFVAGMFAWTGFAYLGEAGPWPRKGLNISFFDFAGFKTPRGHFFECLWREEPRVYLVTSPADSSEFSYHAAADQWTFSMQKTPPPVWSELRRWEWYTHLNEHWEYAPGEEIVVQAYTNCPEAELFLNGRSLGRRKRADFAEDNIIKWLVPYAAGELVVRAYREGALPVTSALRPAGPPAAIALDPDRRELAADPAALLHLAAELVDAGGNPVRTADGRMEFSVTGGATLEAVDNGWERNVEPHYAGGVTTHRGRALAVLRSDGSGEPVRVTVRFGQLERVMEIGGAAP